MVKSLITYITGVLLLFYYHHPSTEPHPTPYRPVKADLEAPCLASVVWYEARGEKIDAQRAVLDVVYHRALFYGKSFCQVVAMPQQFSWYKRYGVSPLDTKRKTLLQSVKANQEVLKNGNFRWFFSGPDPPWAKNMVCRRLGHLKFCKEKS